MNHIIITSTLTICESDFGIKQYCIRASFVVRDLSRQYKCLSQMYCFHRFSSLVAFLPHFFLQCVYLP